LPGGGGSRIDGFGHNLVVFQFVRHLLKAFRDPLPDRLLRKQFGCSINIEFAFCHDIAPLEADKKPAQTSQEF
jgi:hypothetical protein